MHPITFATSIGEKQLTGPAHTQGEGIRQKHEYQDQGVLPTTRGLSDQIGKCSVLSDSGLG